MCCRLFELASQAISPKEDAEFANEIQRFAVEKTRMGIPVLIYDECLHGCMAKGSTIFPQSIALASTWNPDLMREVARAIGRETSARGIHQCLSPTINIAGDPRCGRTEETYGEDPYLASIMGVSFVEGVQIEKAAATLKHLVANFVGTGGWDSNDVNVSERILRVKFSLGIFEKSYVDLRGKQAMFPFGHGLSYTRFKYSNLKISPQRISPRGKVDIRVDLENMGGCKGDEVVQLYIHDTVSSIAKPIKELKGFIRVVLESGEEKTVNFSLASEELSSYDVNMNLVVEPGIFEMMIGRSSEDIRLRGSFEIVACLP